MIFNTFRESRRHVPSDTEWTIPVFLLHTTERLPKRSRTWWRSLELPVLPALGMVEDAGEDQDARSFDVVVIARQSRVRPSRVAVIARQSRVRPTCNICVCDCLALSSPDYSICTLGKCGLCDCPACRVQVPPPTHIRGYC